VAWPHIRLPHPAGLRTIRRPPWALNLTLLGVTSKSLPSPRAAPPCLVRNPATKLEASGSWS